MSETTKGRSQLKLIGSLLVAGFILWTIFAAVRSGSGETERLNGVIIQAPPGYYIEPVVLNNTADYRELAAAIEKMVAERPELSKLGVRINGNDHFLLLDVSDDTIQELSANQYGTAVQTLWRGNAVHRLAYARKSGSLSGNHYSEPITRNLYH